MICIVSPNAKEKDFVGLLEKSRKLMLDFLNDKKDISSTYFETIVFEQMCEASKGTIFEGTVKQTGTYDFPDIVANKYFGVEVKMTTNDHWTSTGNSVLESSRIEDVERIYIIFGKFGGKLDIRHRLYQECLSEISVTHSPRYRIDMDLPSGKSIFDKIGIDYDTLRKDANPIRKIKNYYRSKLKDGEELWWIDQSDGTSVSPIIENFSNLDASIKEKIKIECMTLFPEIFGGSSTKYQRAAVYLVVKFNVVSSSFRDWFSAGGQVNIKINDRKTIRIPKKYYKLYCAAKDIKNKIKELDEETLKHYWKTQRLSSDRINQYKKLINGASLWRSGQYKLSNIFDAGLL